MVGSMLIGAWLLIHHQCCAVAEKDSRMRGSLLVEQLTRRSNLEKNFMRFGRSSLLPAPVEPDPEALASSRLVKKDVFSNYNRFARARSNKNFIRFGRNRNQPFKKLVDLKENLGQETKEDNMIRPTRAKEDFMRFGRDDEEQRLDEFSRYSRAKEDFMRFGRGFGEKISDFNRPARAKQDFMRFGRGFDEPSDDFNRALRGNEAILSPDGEHVERTDEFNRPTRAKQDFMRFGRSFSKQPNDFNRPMRAKDNFMRFGRQFFPTYEYKRPGRAREDFMRFGRGHQVEEESVILKPSKLLESKEESKELDSMKKRWHRDDSEGELDNEAMGHGGNDVRSEHGSNSSRDSREEDDDLTEVDRLNLHLKKPDDDNCIEEKEDICMKQHSDFLRFSRSDRPVVRSQRGKDLDAHFIRFGRALPSPFQPGFIVGPELTILPPLHFKQSRSDASNSMRLG